jgi:hypothetical protein
MKFGKVLAKASGDLLPNWGWLAGVYRESERVHRVSKQHTLPTYLILQHSASRYMSASMQTLERRPATYDSASATQTKQR